MNYIDFEKSRRELNGQEYFSQAGQELFAIAMLAAKKNGFYCEIGGADPFESNNTFVLEKNLQWRGFSLEFDPTLNSRFNDARTNECICADATTYDYLKKFKSLNFPKQIDYLSVDIEPAESSYIALSKIPLDEYRFSVITFEHEVYRVGTDVMDRSRKLLNSHGYQLVIRNVTCFGRDFEDWWVDPKVIPESTWKQFEGANREFSTIF